jgi:hypothetical protein
MVGFFTYKIDSDYRDRRYCERNSEKNICSDGLAIRFIVSMFTEIENWNFNLETLLLHFFIIIVACNF